MTATIIHADDDAVICNLVKRQIEILQKEIEQPIEALSAQDGIEAIALYNAAREQGRNIALVITDYNMPRANGADVAKAIQASSSVPVIFHCSEADKYAKDFNAEYAVKGCSDLTGLLRKYLSPKPRLLLVEDNNDVRDALADGFDAYGYTVIQAENAENAVPNIHTVHAILSDVNQAGSMGGYGLLKKARERYSVEKLPFFLMSAGIIDIKKCIQFDAFPVHKEKGFTEIEALIRNVLPQHLKPAKQQ
ncbi:MAG: response regulator [Candidatus Woesearchaeota archaeon]